MIFRVPMILRYRYMILRNRFLFVSERMLELFDRQYTGYYKHTSNSSMEFLCNSVSG